MTAALWKRGTATRWIYRLENTVLDQNKWATKRRKFAELQRLLTRVWQRESPGGWEPPTLEFGPGVVYAGKRYSFSMGRLGYAQKIHLCPGGRNHLTLLHETAHALGPVWHGKSFIRTYFPLLIEYGRYDAELIHGLAIGRGVPL